MIDKRVQSLRSKLSKQNIDALLITYPINRRYITGFTGSSGFALMTSDHAILITDPRYLIQSQQEAPDWTVVIHEGLPEKTIIDQCRVLGIRSLAFESEYVTFQMYRELKEYLREVQLIPVQGWIEKLRAQKSPKEIERIRQATAIVDQVFEKVLTELRPGMTEREVATRLEILLREQGASSSSFPTIVASGERSALPHGLASPKPLNKGDFVTLDFGAWYEGYTSDITRTVVLGLADEKQKEIYHIVLEAQQKAIASIAPGMSGKQVDRVARDCITVAGYGEYFGHATGHGIGLEVHELPLLRKTSEDILEEGMVVTVEPGIYVPGIGGVRIEDDVLVTLSGQEVLTKAPKHLIEIDC